MDEIFVAIEKYCANHTNPEQFTYNFDLNDSGTAENDNAVNVSGLHQTSHSTQSHLRVIK